MKVWFITFEYFSAQGEPKKGYQFINARDSLQFAGHVDQFKTNFLKTNSIMADSFQVTSIMPV